MCIIRVASRTVAHLCDDKKSPDRLILESPFNNVRDEIRNHPLSYVYCFYSIFYSSFFLLIDISQ